MSPTLVTAVLLLVGVLNEVTAVIDDGAVQFLCNNIFTEEPCEGNEGWNKVGSASCVKYFTDEKSFDDAQAHCSSLGSNLVSIHNPIEMNQILCVSFRANLGRHSFWIGLRRSGDNFAYTDGSEYNYQQWADGQPDNFNNEECVEANHKDWGWWNDDDCADLNHYMCAKLME